MAQYIDKDAVVAGIERLGKNAWESFQKGNSTEEQYYLRYGVIQDTLSLINNLEVKEVDLEKEIDLVWNKTSDDFLEDGWIEFESIAKHFFELGMAMSNKVQIGK